MFKLLKQIWDAKPVVLVGAFASAWTAIVALDQVDDSWFIPSLVYIVAVPVMAFLTRVIHKQVS